MNRLRFRSLASCSDPRSGQRPIRPGASATITALPLASSVLEIGHV